MTRILLALFSLVSIRMSAQPIYCLFDITPETCSNANGTVLASVGGGDGQYTLLWSPSPPNGQGTTLINGLSAGSYDLLITDGQGAQATFTAVVTNEADIANGILGDGTYSGAWGATGFGIPCEGQCNGAMAMPASMFNGTAPYTFTWSDPGISFLANTLQGDPVFFGFCAGQNYSYTVYDQFGCSANSVTITPPMISAASLWSLSSVTPATCGNADGSAHFTNLDFWPTQIAITNSNGALISNILIASGPYTSLNLSAGIYTATFQFHSSACSQTIPFTVTEEGPGCGTLSGTLFHDVNTDCIHDGNEPGIALRLVQVDPGAELMITNADGTFLGGLADGAYTLTVLDPTVTPICPQAQPIPFTVSGSSTTLEIGASSTSPFDLAVNAVSGPARPGFAYTVWAHVLNTGSQPSGTVQFTAVLDADLSFVSAVPSPSNVNGNTLTWDMPVHGAFSSSSIQILTQVNTQAVLGEAVDVVLSAVNNGPETSTTNNSFTLTRTITGSYDPNDKTAFTSTRQSETQYILEEDAWIDYVIRFQNTGTDTVFTVVVTDTLAAELNMATFEQGAASHPFNVSFKPGRVVEWRFTNIMLPDSNVNEAASHGAAGFRIRPMEPLLAGTELNNNADIFFDFNLPIRTNTSTLVANFSTGIQATTSAELQVFPNPTRDRFTVTVKGEVLDQIRLIAADGRVVLQQRLTGERADVPVAGLATGVYRAEVRTVKGEVMHSTVLIHD